MTSAGRQYGDLDDLAVDILLMCKNAQQYNEEASLIYEDSIVLERVYQTARRQADQFLAQPPGTEAGQSYCSLSVSQSGGG